MNQSGKEVVVLGRSVSCICASFHGEYPSPPNPRAFSLRHGEGAARSREGTLITSNQGPALFDIKNFSSDPV